MLKFLIKNQKKKFYNKGKEMMKGIKMYVEKNGLTIN